MNCLELSLEANGDAARRRDCRTGKEPREVNDIQAIGEIEHVCLKTDGAFAGLHEDDAC